MTKIEKLAGLGRWILRESIENPGCEIDAIEIIDKAKTLYLVRDEFYDPAKHGEMYDCEPGDLIYLEVE